MKTEINKSGFRQSEALLSDAIYLLEFKGQSTEEIKLFKLLKARNQNPDFDLELSEFICGEINNSFPYRSSYYLTKFFTDLGYEYHHDGSTRRFWVRDTLLELNIKNISFIIEKGLFNIRDFRKESKDEFEIKYQKAIREFKDLINDSLNVDKGIDLGHLLDLNINTELLFDKEIITKDEELNQLIKEAKARFYNPKDKHIAVEKLWDSFERIKTYFNSNKKLSSQELVTIISENFDEDIIKEEFKILTTVGNKFRIRHHETDKKEIKDEKHLNYLFFRLLTLIDLCLNGIYENEI